MNVQAAIFDLDGTLLDTLQDIADSCNKALEKVGCPHRTQEEIRMFIGNGLSVLMQKALPQGSSNDLYNKALQILKETYANNWHNKTKPYYGILELLAHLKQKDIKLGIVSNKPDAQVKELTTLYFSDFIDLSCAVGEKESEGIKKKPYPDTLLTVIKNLKIEPKSTVYIGDSDVDVQTASNAQVPCISVCWGFRSERFLQNSGAKLLAHTPKELFEQIVNLDC